MLTQKQKEERNKQNWMAFQTEFVGRGDFSALDKYLTDKGLLMHNMGLDGFQKLIGLSTPEGYGDKYGSRYITRQMFRDMWKSNEGETGADSQKRVFDEIYAFDDMVFCRFHFVMKVKGAFAGMQGHGQELVVEEWGLTKFDDEGRMTEGRFILDSAEIFRQMNMKVVPASAAVK